ncbi:MAG: hypothetical protein SGJ02_04720 [bacterium]|nr:hypothetical protein [bacterium]
MTRRLYRSGESEYFINRVPCRLKDMVDIFRAVGMGARTYNIVAQGEIARIVTAKPDEKRTILEEAAGVLGFRERIAATNRRLDETQTNIARIADIVKEVERNVGSLKRQSTKAKNREALRTRIVELETHLFSDRFASLTRTLEALKVELQAGKDQEAGLETSLNKVQAEEGEVRSKLMGIDVESDGLRSKIDSIKEDLNNRERERQTRKSRLQELVVLEAASETEIKRLRERESTLAERKIVCEQAIETLGKSEEEITNEISGLETGSNEELRNAASRLEAAREALRSVDYEIRNVREQLVGSESKLGALNEQLKAASPATKLKETLGEEGKEYLSRSLGLLVDGITVQDKYVKAIQAVLAERASFLVSDDVKGLGETFVNKLLSDSKNFKKGLALGLFRFGQGEVKEAALKAYCSEEVTPALSVIQIKENFSLAVTNILSEVYCAEDLSSAQTFLESIAGIELAKEPTVVTLAGDVLTRVSFYSFRHEGGLVQLKSNASQLQESVDQLKVKVNEITLLKEGKVAEVSASQSQHEQVLRQAQERSRLVKELSQKLGSARGRLQAEKRLIDQIKQDVDRTTSQVGEIASKIGHLKAEQDRVRSEISNEVTEVEKSLKEDLDRLNQQSSQIESQRRDGRHELSLFTDRVVKARSELDLARSQFSRMALDAQKAELEINHLKDQISEHLGSELLEKIFTTTAEEQLKFQLSEDLVSEYQEEASRLKNRMIREGEVDPASVELCEQETKRLEDLVKQKIDLESAYRTLQRTVEKLTEISQERFMKTFEAVNKNFSELSPKIFGGGSAHLELVDPANPLESGVEIVARPPGKKLKSIELLSGGEKTLCAISLIMGMFLERPSPICVLDEVDAPLDEANVVRFLSLIKEMSTQTQFLLITHNKQTMSVCDQLVGVTMEQPGASKIVTVSLDEAFTHAVNS